MNRKIILAVLLAGTGTGLSACVAVPYETSPQYRGADRDRDGVPNRVDREPPKGADSARGGRSRTNRERDEPSTDPAATPPRPTPGPAGGPSAGRPRRSR